jgi:hypothetical protein
MPAIIWGPSGITGLYVPAARLVPDGMRYRLPAPDVILFVAMYRLAVLAVALATLACGSASVSLGAPLTITQLKFKVIDTVGPPAFCDPDYYPIAREGGEQASAIAMYDQIRADTELYGAIVAHEHLPSANLTDAQKLTVYRAFKKLRALQLTPANGDYSFSYTVDGTFEKASGTVRVDGVIPVVSRAQGSRPNCPICLAATTRIATPAGEMLVTSILPGTLVWTQSPDGERVSVPVLEVGSTPVPPTHLMVHLRLADARELLVSPGHRTADGRQLGSLAVGDIVDGSAVTLWELVPYAGERTYDLLPAGPTGTYWANGILLSSTLLR